MHHEAFLINNIFFVLSEIVNLYSKLCVKLSSTHELREYIKQRFRYIANSLKRKLI